MSILAELVAARATHTEPVTAPPPQELLQIAPRAPEIAVDPVCHMEVAVTPGALRHDHDGRAFHFCAPGCRAAFAADPARYGA